MKFDLQQDIGYQSGIAQFGNTELPLEAYQPFIQKIDKMFSKYLYEFIYNKIVTNTVAKDEYFLCYLSYIKLADGFFSDVIMDKNEYRKLLSFHHRLVSYFCTKDYTKSNLLNSAFYQDSEKIIAYMMLSKIPYVINQIILEQKSKLNIQYRESSNDRDDDRELGLLMEWTKESKYTLSYDLDIDPIIPKSSTPVSTDEEPLIEECKEDEDDMVIEDESEEIPELVTEMMTNVDENGEKTFKINMIDDETLKTWIDILNQNGYETSLKTNGLENYLTIESKKESLLLAHELKLIEEDLEDELEEEAF